MTSVHFTETCEADAPHLIVEVIPTSATMADGDIVGELHAHLDKQQMLPSRHLMDMGYVDAEVLAESQSRYQVDSVGPAMPDTSWASKEAGRFDHRQFQMIGRPTRQLVLPDIAAEIGVISLTDMDNRVCAFVFPFDFAALVRFMHNVPLLLRKC